MSSLRSVLESSLYCLENNISFCLDRRLIVKSNLQNIYTVSLTSSVRCSLLTVLNHSEKVVALPTAVKKCDFCYSNIAQRKIFNDD